MPTWQFCARRHCDIIVLIYTGVETSSSLALIEQREGKKKKYHTFLGNPAVDIQLTLCVCVFF